MKTVLYVGCGPDTVRRHPQFSDAEQWQEIRLDIDPKVQPDVVASMLDMSPIATESMDAVFSSHNLEHLYPHEVGTAVREFRRVLKKDGFVFCLCPDLQSVAALVAQGYLEERAYTSPGGYPIAPLDILYGWRLSLSKGEMHMAHHGGFTNKTLAHALLRGGFASVAVRRQPRLFQLSALATVRRMPGKDIEALLLQYMGVKAPDTPA